MSTAAGRPGGQEPSRGKHIIVADDEALVRGVLRRILTIQGYVVHEATNGKMAAELARRGPVDLVITDLWMPVMNGVELIEALRAMRCAAEVIVLSGHITTTTSEKLRKLGVFRVLAKPAHIETLLEAVREGLESDRGRRLAEDSAEGPGKDAGNDSRRGPMALVADDDDEVRGLLREVLSRAGYRVEEARNGEEAVEKALAHGVGLVLMDLDSPRVGGRKVVDALRRASRDCVIMCMTGECGKREIEAVLRAGAASCFRKPFDTARLLAEIGRLDLIATHRKHLAEREHGRTDGGSLLERGRAFIRTMKHRYGMRLKWLAAAAVATVAFGAAAVPLVLSFVATSARAVRDAGGRVDEVLESTSRIEAYLQRDEARELISERW